MDKLTLQQQIALWKTLLRDSGGETDDFIDALVNRIDELENEVEELGYQILERTERDY